VDKFSSLDTSLSLENESISVSQLNKLAKSLLENNMPVFWVKGEVSGLKIYNHAYFDLKDEGGKISCVIFARSLALAEFKLDNGQQIEVRGRVTIYQANGSYQINVERIRMLGVGDLWEAYQRLVNKLTSEGLFDKRYKKPLPTFPQTIGLITSKEGAVIKDVITTLKRRMPNITIIVYHTLVQGVEAGMQIAKTIRIANSRNEVDVLIVCRGGGSINDLWAFNEEVVAREVFASSIPLISAVGHETDTTIIDFVADLRAPTPTAAAELVARSRDEWITLIHKLKLSLDNQTELILNNYRQRIDLYLAKLKALNPQNRLRERANILKSLHMRLNTSFRQLIKDRQNSLIGLQREMDLLNPTNILSRGYAIIKNKQGNVVFGSKDVANSERISILFSEDIVSAIIDKKHIAQQEELI
jgi:exodeoxyribonuclease VII large subunit